MNHDSPPGPSRPAAGGEFTWPPTSEELDAIEVIRIDDPSPARPLAVAPAFTRGRRLRLPRRDDLVLAGVTITSVLAIATAAFMQFSDRPLTPAETHDQPIPPVALSVALPLTATSLPVMSPLATAPVAARTVERRRAAPSRSRAYARRAAIARPSPSPSMRLSRDADYVRPRLISPERGRSGKLVLLVEVRKNGKVGDVDVLSSNLDRDNRSHRDLQRAAISTVKRWRYTPAIRDGEPAGTQVRVVVDINLDSGAINSASEAGARRKAAAANRAVDSVRAAR